LNDGEKLRVLPIVMAGAASNLDDLLSQRGVDVAATQSDVFEFFRTSANHRSAKPHQPHHPPAWGGIAIPAMMTFVGLRGSCIYTSRA
jgi:alkanesulfonate monooxygenase SsuD/methylene tetrahydromethanopterin reductase-like flavin-dependent oxidoreductase (luciferase family)